MAVGAAKKCFNDPECRETVNKNLKTGAKNVMGLTKQAVEIYREFNKEPEKYEVCDEYTKFFSPVKRNASCIDWDTVTVHNEDLTLDRNQTVEFRKLRTTSVFVKEGCETLNGVLYKFKCYDDKIIIAAQDRVYSNCTLDASGEDKYIVVYHHNGRTVAAE